MWFLSFLFGTLWGDKFFANNLVRLFGGAAFSDYFFSDDTLVQSVVGNPVASPTPTTALSGLTTDDIAVLNAVTVQTLTTAQIAGLPTNFIPVFTSDAISGLLSEQLAALRTDEVAALTTGQVVALTTFQFPGLLTSTINALTSNQVKAIETRDIQALTSSQIAKLSTDVVQALTTDQVVALTTVQIQALNTADIVALSTDQIPVIETQDIAALTTAQIAVIETRDIAVFTTDQVAALSSAQLAALSPAQSAALPSLVFLNIPSLTTAQIAALTVPQIVGLTTDQIVSLSTAQAAAISTAGIAALTTAELVAFETVDLAALTNSQIAALTSAQTVVFTTDQVEAFTSNQISAFTIPAYQQLDTRGTPIILDLNGDGVHTLGMNAGVTFDLFADGQATHTGWVSASDGLLVLDRNHDGAINDGSELFGSSTRLLNGSNAPDGYAALRELDSNHDGVISNEDDAFADLRVWVDGNSDGVSDYSEIRSLDSLAISKINVNATTDSGSDNGNILGLVSSYETLDGLSHDAADVWFRVDKKGPSPDPASVDSAIAALGGTPFTVVMAQASYAPPIDPVSTWTKAQALSLVPELPASEGGDGLRFRVSGIAQAMGSFADKAMSQGDALTLPSTPPSVNVATGSSSAAIAVVSMADVMRQFDSNGNLIGSPAMLASSSTVWTATSTKDAPTTGLLATGGGT